MKNRVEDLSEEQLETQIRSLEKELLLLKREIKEHREIPGAMLFTFHRLESEIDRRWQELDLGVLMERVEQARETMGRISE